jgi:hypothetical protein
MHIDELSLDELLDLNEQICLWIDYLRARNDMLMLSQLRLDQQVDFMAPEGRMFGTLIKLNKKSVVNVSDDKKQWKVPPAMVNVVKSV